MPAGAFGAGLEAQVGMAAEFAAAGSAGSGGHIFYQSGGGKPGVSRAGRDQSRHSFDMLSVGISWACGTLRPASPAFLVAFSQK